LHRSAIGHVTRPHLAGAARSLDRCVNRRKTLRASSHKDDVTPIFGEAFGDGPADAAACSSNDGDALLYGSILRAALRGEGESYRKRHKAGVHFGRARRARKNSVSSFAHCAARTPPCISTRWFSRRSTGIA
jgi:hypothetical protein